MFVLRVDELIEIALGSAGCFFLVDKFEAILVELVEELVPGDLLQVLVVSIPGLREAEAEDARLAASVGVANLGRHRTARFRPLANCVVILGCFGEWHC